MEGNLITTILAGAGLLLALLGWVYQLGFLSARIVRNEKDIEKLAQDIKEHEKNTELKDSNWRKEIRESFGKIYQKIDELPCKNPGWNKESC